MPGGADDERMKKILAQYPLRRLGRPDDVTPMILLLASPLSSWTTGQVVSVNGGYAMAVRSPSAPVPAPRFRTSSLFGARVRRKEDGRLLRGRGRYVSDVELPRMLHVAFVRSVHAHARLVRIDAAAALAAAGVVAVVTGEEPSVAGCRMRARSALPTYVETEQPVLAWPKVRFCGEAVAAVVAADRYLAEDAAGLVAVDYEPLPAVVDVGDARGAAAIVHDEAPDNVLLSRRFDHGDVEAALASSAAVVERVFRTNRQTAAPLEGRGGVADWNAAEGKLTLYSGTQVPHLARHALGEILGLPENRVRVVAPDVGGGFGVKAIVYPEDVALCLLAMRLERPVKWVETRREGFVASAHARDHRYAVRAGFDAAGRLTAMDVRADCNAGAYSVYPWTAGIEALMAGGLLTGPYKLGSLPLRGGGAGDEHDAGGSVSRGGPSGHHLRDGARARPRRPARSASIPSRSGASTSSAPAICPTRRRRGWCTTARAIRCASRRSSRRSAMARSGPSRRACAPRGATSASASRATTS